MFYTIQSTQTDLFLVMDVMTSDISWGKKENCMVFSSSMLAEKFGNKQGLEHWQVRNIDLEQLQDDLEILKAIPKKYSRLSDEIEIEEVKNKIKGMVK